MLGDCETLDRFTEATRAEDVGGGIFFSGDGVKSNSDAAIPPPSLSLGVGMASGCIEGWATRDDDDNNTGTVPGIAFPGCAAMFPSKLGSTL